MFPTLESNIKNQLAIYRAQLTNIERRFVLKSISEFEFNQEKAMLKALIKEFETWISIVTNKL